MKNIALPILDWILYALVVMAFVLLVLPAITMLMLFWREDES